MSYKNKEDQLTCQRRWYHNNKEKQYNWNKKYKASIRKLFWEYKQTLKCESCGESDAACLVFHHINPKEKEMSIASVVGRGWGWDRILKEINKCQVLCANCHRKLHFSREKS